ncbi:MAG: sigma-54-dependent Fis family transcriptional regulator [Planctomycetes bacterium]|nr:sigma-54-dependent Fis family transcriptional regulator [Planctomycetota bacterium]
MVRALIVDDDLENREIVAENVTRWGHQVETAASGEEAISKFTAAPFDVVVSDIRMGAASGLDVLRRVRGVSPDAIVILMTGYAGSDTAIDAIKAGAFDYVTKPFKYEELRRTIEKALELRKMTRQAKPARAEEARKSLQRLIGRSRPMLEIYKMIARAAETPSSVLLQGESGTGKSLIAQAIHANSPRAEKPFLTVNCSALTETLLESELFGHKKGSFTGATADREGVFKAADGGTLFLDEVGDTSAALQMKLLLAIEEGEIKPVGSNEVFRADVRIISATNKDLKEMVARREMREDLYYRLNVVTIHVPPLRERREDIPLLVEHFVKMCCERMGKATVAVHPEAMEKIQAHDWPGNIRELHHVIESALALSGRPILVADDLQIAGGAKRKGPAAGEEAGPLVTLEEREKEYIQRVLAATRGNRQAAAEILGIDRKTLYRKCLKFGFDVAGEAEETPGSS